jgi:hypothetical protein
VAIEYVNRCGERYYLLQGKTKTGKPKYYVSRKPDGVPVDEVPEGCELHENPERDLVSVRKVRSSRVLPAEREMLARWIRELAGIERFSIDVEADSLVVYTPNSDPAAMASTLSRIFGSFSQVAADLIATQANYTAMFRFALVDESRRLYTAERWWCFRGGIDGWYLLAGLQTLESLARKYLPHLNRESFFELM